MADIGGSDSQVPARADAWSIRGRRARAAFSYEPQECDELELKVGDILIIHGEDEEGWYEATLNGKTGVCPSNFVEFVQEPQATEESRKTEGIGLTNIFAGEQTNLQVETANEAVELTALVTDQKPSERALENNVPPLNKENSAEYAIAEFDYEAQNGDELTFKVGDIIQIVTKECEDEGWWMGKLNGVVGVFPDNFCKVSSLSSAVSIIRSTQSSSRRDDGRGTAATVDNSTSAKIFVANLDAAVDNGALRALFEQFGGISGANVVRDQNGRCFGFVQFHQPESAHSAISQLNGKCIGVSNQKLHVAWAKTSEEKQQKSREAVIAGTKKVSRNQQAQKQTNVCRPAGQATSESGATGNLCVVCLDKPITVLMRPCKHISLCKGCAPSIKECPLCRKAVQSVEDVFISGA